MTIFAIFRLSEEGWCIVRRGDIDSSCVDEEEASSVARFNSVEDAEKVAPLTEHLGPLGYRILDATPRQTRN